ncbi:MAG: hypothetical protein ACHBN1_23660 [Heteroscytonema crispum UTEX LB 1556]
MFICIHDAVGCCWMLLHAAQIAQENNSSENYIKQLVAPKLWQILSAAIG